MVERPSSESRPFRRVLSAASISAVFLFSAGAQAQQSFSTGRLGAEVFGSEERNIEIPDISIVEDRGPEPETGSVITRRARDPKAVEKLQTHHDEMGWGTPYDLYASFSATGQVRYNGNTTAIRFNRAGTWYAWFDQGAIMVKVEKRGSNYVAFAAIQRGTQICDYPPVTLRNGAETKISIPGGFEISLKPTIAPKTLDVAISDEVLRRTAEAARANARGRTPEQCGPSNCLPADWNPAEVNNTVRTELTAQFAARSAKP